MIHVRIGDETHELSWDEWEARVRAGRVPPTAEIRFEPVTGDGFVAAGELDLYRSALAERERAFQRVFVSSSAPILTAVLVGFQIQLWWWLRTSDSARLVNELTNWAPPILEEGQVWRLYTSGLLHVDGLHLAGNLFWLALVTWNLERALGGLNVLTLFFASVLGGAVLSVFGTPENPSLGASGGVFGLIAAAVVFGFIRSHILPQRGRVLFGLTLLPYLVLGFLSGLSNPGVDNLAHLGGLLTGAGLAFVLDPPMLQRRPRWNTWTLGIVWAVALLVPLILVPIGPRVIGLADAHTVEEPRMPGTPPKPGFVIPDNLDWWVPASWTASETVDGVRAARSPEADTWRAFSVRLRSTGDPADARESLAKWRSSLAEMLPQASFGEVFPTEVAGFSGFGQVVDVPGGVPARLELRIGTRGVHLIEERWQVEPAFASRLAPLAQRLRASVSWSYPMQVTVPRRVLARHADAVAARRDLAGALTELGEADEALRIWTGLVEEHPGDLDLWRGLLRALRWYPDHAPPDIDPLLDRALAQHPDTDLVAEVARFLDARGDVAGEGLLDLAWARRPGDRDTRSARGRMLLSLDLDPATLLPWWVAFDPLERTARTPQAARALVPARLDLAAARARGETRAATRTALWDDVEAQVRANEIDAAARDLLILRWDHVPVDGVEAIKAVLTDLSSQDVEGPLRWAPDDAPARWARLVAERANLIEDLDWAAANAP